MIELTNVNSNMDNIKPKRKIIRGYIKNTPIIDLEKEQRIIVKAGYNTYRAILEESDFDFNYPSFSSYLGLGEVKLKFRLLEITNQ